MRNYLMYLFTIITCSVLGQTTLKNSYYNLNLPKLTSFEKANSTVEKLSNIDLYKIINSDNQQTKYLIYLMSNRLNINLEEISDYNFKDYFKDIGKVEVLDSKSIFFEGKKYYEIKISLDNNIIGLMYITNQNDILYRLLFMMPNEEYYSKYLNEIKSIFESVSLLKNKWEIPSSSLLTISDNDD